MMSSKGQIYAMKIVDFISKTEGPVYFEQVGMYVKSFLVNSKKNTRRRLEGNKPFDLSTSLLNSSTSFLPPNIWPDMESKAFAAALLESNPT